jgi:hypothetical protein
VAGSFSVYATPGGTLLVGWHPAMAQNYSYDDDDYEEEDWGGAPEAAEDYAADDLDEPTVPCPYCRREIHEDAERCPHCERYISAEDAPVQRKPWWILIGVALCLYAILSWFL